MRIIAILTLLVGVIGGALTYLAVINVMPIQYFAVIAIVGAVLVIFTRRPGD
ncbi:MAG: hypothetical protein VCD00_06975 [Candidatus Hydrogenedentota bacterium]